MSRVDRICMAERSRGGVPARVQVLGVGVDRVDLRAAVERIGALVAVGVPAQVVTVNPEFVMAARRDPVFRGVLNGAALAVPDGMGIIWAARILGDRLPERVGGVELVEALAALAPARGYRLFLLGAAEGVAEAAARALRSRYPGLQIVGTYAGSPATEDEAAILHLLREARPDILLVAFGAPAQDLWIARNLARSGGAVAVGVGGAFDYLSGRVPRAPGWIQRAGLEWLYRLARQPWRWRRMLALPRFGALVCATRALSEVRTIARGSA